MNWKAVFAFCICITVCSFAQTTTDYSSIVQKGNAQLQAGSNDAALAAGKQAITIDSQRWEGYALAGGALMNSKRYNEAAAEFDEAIKRAPKEKQSGLLELRKQSLAAEGNAPTSDSAKATLPSQAEIVLWKSIENSTNPADFVAYLDQYPHGNFAALAQQHLQQAKDKQQQDAVEKQKLEQDALWTDPATGLMWTKRDNGEDVGFSQAADYCRNLKLAGFSGWTIPTFDQLKTIHAMSSWHAPHIRSDFQLTNGTGALWSSTSQGMGSYFSGRIAREGYVILQEPGKGDGMRTLCVRKP